MSDFKVFKITKVWKTNLYGQKYVDGIWSHWTQKDIYICLITNSKNIESLKSLPELSWSTPSQRWSTCYGDFKTYIYVYIVPFFSILIFLTNINGNEPLLDIHFSICFLRHTCKYNCISTCTSLVTLHIQFNTGIFKSVRNNEDRLAGSILHG